MLITPIGYIFLSLGVVWFLQNNQRNLFKAFIVSSYLFHVSVINPPVFTPYIKAAFLFGGLIMLKKTLDAIVCSRSYPLNAITELRILKVFYAVILISLIMPVLKENQLMTFPIDAGPMVLFREGFVLPLKLRRSNITQLIRPFLTIIIFFAILPKMHSVNTLKYIIRTSIIMILFVLATGIIYQISAKTGAPFYRFIHYITLGEYISPRFCGDLLPRMFSIAGEPGMTGFMLSFGLALAAPMVLIGGSDILWSRKTNFIILAAIFSGVILSTGTRGYLGLVFIFLSLLFLPLVAKNRTLKNFQMNSLVKSLFIIIVLLLLAQVVFNYVSSNPYEYIQQDHISKMTDGTPEDPNNRFMLIQKAVELFCASPVLGVGWGSHQTKSVAFTLLSNVGLMGFIPFYLFNFLIIKKGIHLCRYCEDKELVVICMACLSALICGLGVASIAQPIAFLHFFPYWIVCGVIIMAERIWIQQEDSIEKNRF